MSDAAASPEPTFEQAMERLETIVSAMEGDRMPLEEMVASYEEGMNLLNLCRQRIETARRRVELITARADSKVTLTPFEADDSSAEAGEDKPKSQARRRATKPEATEPDDDIRLF